MSKKNKTESRFLEACCLLAGLAIVVSGCSSEPPNQQTNGAVLASSEDAPARPDESVVATDGSTDASASSDNSEGAPQSEAAADTRGHAKKLDGPRPVKLPWKNEVPVHATLSSECVRGGEALTLSVETEPEAAVIYQAVYSDNLGGAPKPLGGGYGGNDKGYADADGSWQSTWVVSPTAPAGPARVDVIVGYGQQWGYDGPTFAVAGRSGKCESTGGKG